jgi:hypothetical protein
VPPGFPLSAVEGCVVVVVGIVVVCWARERLALRVAAMKPRARNFLKALGFVINKSPGGAVARCQELNGKHS